MQLDASAPDTVVKRGVAGAVGGGVAVFRRELAGGALLPVKRRAGGVDKALAAVEAVVQVHAVALDLVEGGQADDAGRGHRRLGDGRQHVPVDVAIQVIDRQADAILVVGAVDQLGQDRIGLVVLRIGRRAVGIGRVVGPGRLLALAIAPGIGQQGFPAVGLAGQQQALGPALVGRGVADASAAGELVVALQDVGRILGDEADRAGQAVGAVEGRGGAAHDLDRLQGVEVNVVAATDRLGAEGEAVRDAHAVHDDQHAIAFQAADVEAGIAVAARRGAGGGEAGRGVADRHARLVANQVLDVLDQAVVDLFRRDDRDRRRDLGDRLFRTRGGDGDLVDLDRVAVCAVLCISGRGQQGGGRGGRQGGELQARHRYPLR